MRAGYITTRYVYACIYYIHGHGHEHLLTRQSRHGPGSSAQTGIEEPELTKAGGGNCTICKKATRLAEERHEAARVPRIDRGVKLIVSNVGDVQYLCGILFEN